MPWLTPDSSWEAVAEDMAVDSEAAATAAVDLEAIPVDTVVGSNPSEEDMVDGPAEEDSGAIPVDTVAGMEEDTEVGTEVDTEVVRLSRSSR